MVSVRQTILAQLHAQRKMEREDAVCAQAGTSFWIMGVISSISNQVVKCVRQKQEGSALHAPTG